MKNRRRNAFPPRIEGGGNGLCRAGKSRLPASKEDVMSNRINAPEGYRLLEESELPDFAGYGQVFLHEKSGARVCTVKNADVNRTFCIAFRTTPTDSTGVPHIIEHSVLCGSDKYPLKDPFMELAKGSLNTFLNAFTYPDKTMYPISSCNKKDFRNLKDVYLDAVFHPAIYHTPEIFRQEGWRYELTDPEGELTINGVVYNEMKGAFSNADEVVDRVIQQELFPDTTYGVESGGDPDFIPELTYEQFLDFHRTYYHPSNSYIFFYGDLDMEEELSELDRDYLSGFSKIPVNSEIGLQEPIGIRRKTITYPVSEEEEETGSYLTYSVVMKESADVKRALAWDVLYGALVNAPGAPVKQALLDAGIGTDITGGFSNYIRQTGLTIMAKEADGSREEDFVRIIRETCEGLVRDGIKKETLLGIINSNEFAYREQDYGSASKGLYLFVEMLNSWLYHEEAVFDYAKLGGLYAELREEVGRGYFEKLLKEDLLRSNHVLILTANPEQGLAVRKEAELKKKLAEKKAGLTPAELSAMIKETADLRAFQEEEDSEEKKQCLPLLALSDIEPTVPAFSNEESENAGIRTVSHDIFTNGIAYVKLLFDVNGIPAEELPLLGLLSSCLSFVNTEHYTYTELADRINLVTGGIRVKTENYSDSGDFRRFHPYLTVSLRVLYDKLGDGLELIPEILSSSDFRDRKRLREMLQLGISRLRTAFEGGGHSAMVRRAAAGLSEQDYFSDRTKGIGELDYLRSVMEDFDGNFESLAEGLTGLLSRIVRPEKALLSITADETGIRLVKKSISEAFGKLFAGPAGSASETRAPYPLTSENEGFTYAGQVQFLAACGNYKAAGLPYTGALKVARNLLSTDYLWNQVRVKGGAYGCMCNFAALNGNAYFVSYRDPKLLETLGVYRNAAEYFRTLSLSDRELTKFIIGTIGELDTPRSPKDEGEFALNMYISGHTLSKLQQERDEVLGVTVPGLRSLAPYMEAVVNGGRLAALGSESRMKSEGPELFPQIRPLA